MLYYLCGSFMLLAVSLNLAPPHPLSILFTLISTKIYDCYFEKELF